MRGLDEIKKMNQRKSVDEKKNSELNHLISQSIKPTKFTLKEEKRLLNELFKPSE